MGSLRGRVLTLRALQCDIQLKLLKDLWDKLHAKGYDTGILDTQ